MNGDHQVKELERIYGSAVVTSDRYDLCRHSHLLETRAQQQLCLEKFGCTGVEHLQRLGYLGSRTSLAHGIWLTDSDIQLLAESGSTVVHNPLSNLRLGSGIAPVLKYRQARVNVSFGCDGAASSDGQDLWEAIKLGTILHCVTEGDYRQWITPRQSLEMAALGGAKGVNLGDQLGSLQVGKSADLVLIDLKGLSLLPRTDPVGLLVLGRPERVVDQVWIRGHQIVREGQPMSISTDTLKQQLFKGSTWQVKRISPATLDLEQRYRAVMDLECS